MNSRLVLSWQCGIPESVDIAQQFGQMLAYTSGNIMHTFIINVSDQSREM
ncbi:hypothetical protein I3B23_11705 [Salmonella enterica]|nr:hypothetical protein [Salmonella enterica]